MNLLVKNAASLLFSQAGATLMSAVLLVFVPPYFGDETFGRYTFALVIVGFFTMVGSAGTRPFLIKAVARDRQLLGSYVVNAVVLKAMIAVVLATVVMLGGFALGLDDETMLFVGAACFTMIGSMVVEIFASGLFGLERMTLPSTTAVVSTLAAGAITLAGIWLGLEPTVIVYTTVPTMLIPIVALALAVRSEVGGFRQYPIRAGVWRAVAFGGFPFFLHSLILFGYGNVDLPMLRAMTGPETVGWYSLAYRIISLPVLVGLTILRALFPSFARDGQVDPGLLAHRVNRALRFISFIGFPVAAGVFTIAPDVIDLLYSGEFEQSIGLIRILAIALPMTLIGQVIVMALFATDKQTKFLVVGLIAFAINPTVNFLAIPWTDDRYGNGALGAAAATLLTEVCIVVGGLMIRPPGVANRTTMWFLLRTLLASALIVPAGIAVSSFGPVVVIVVGVLTFAVASYVLRAVPEPELRRLLSLVRRPKTGTVADEADPDGGRAVAPNPNLEANLIDE